jgi:beta-aspartyl-dipeptidase (metallo-type)
MMIRKDENMLTLLRNGRVFDPLDRGRVDVLLCGGKVVAVRDSIPEPAGLDVDIADASEHILTPGFVDLHVHVTGGGGEGGPATRVPEIQLSAVTTAGVTTVVGLLGTDDVTRHPETLLAKILGLRAEGLSAFMMCGSYQFPPATITGSVRKDIALIGPVIGVGEVALSDHRSSQPSFDEFTRLVAEARAGGLLGGKVGLVQIHMGGGSRGMDYIFRMARETELPLGQVLPTHVTRSEELFQHALSLVTAGGNIDITASGTRALNGVDSSQVLSVFMARELPLQKLTMSSDSNGSIPRFDPEGSFEGFDVAGMDSLQDEFRRLITAEGFPVTDVLGLFTSNPAARIGMKGRKGCLTEGADADLIMFRDDWKIDRVYAHGRLMVDQGKPVVRGTFEH